MSVKVYVPYPRGLSPELPNALVPPVSGVVSAG